MERGAAGFLPKSYSSLQISQVLRMVLAGGVFRPSDHTQLPRTAADGPYLEAHAQMGPQDREPALLTDRQMQVLALMVQGKPNKIICDELNLAPGTVKIHISSVLRALHVTNRTQAVLEAARLGLKL
jgi:DNA-binding NarL/FixJ family response regulator